MRKILVIDEQMEKLLINVFDAAFRATGIQTLPSWKQFEASIKTEEDSKTEDK